MILTVKRQGEIPKNIYICPQHFEPECFERDLKVVGNKFLKILMLLFFHSNNIRLLTFLINLFLILNDVLC